MRSAEAPEAVLLHGARHACVLRYVSIDALDPLADFLLDAIAEEPRIEVLSSSLGLHERMIQDMLAELVRRGLVALDLYKGEVNRLRRSEANPIEVDSHVYHVWQDHVTGAVLPARLVDRYRDRLEPSRALRAVEGEEPVWFRDLPSGQLIPMLLRLEPEIQLGPVPNSRLDRIVERYPIRGQRVWLPLRPVPVRDPVSGQEVVHHYIDAPELPSWVVRSWTQAHRRQAAQTEGDSVFLDVPIGGGAFGTSSLDLPSLRYHVRNWAQAAHDALHGLPAPESIHDLRPVNERHAQLRERLRGLARVQLVKDADVMAAVFERARRHIVVVISDAEGDTLRAVRRQLRELRPDAPRRVCVLLGDAGRTLAPERLTEIARDLSQFADPQVSLSVVRARDPGLSGDFVVADAIVAWLAAGGSEALRIEGPSVVRSLLGVTAQALPEEQEGVLWLRHLAPGLQDEWREPLEVRLGEGTGRSIAELLELVERWRRDLTYAVAEPNPVACKGPVDAEAGKRSLSERHPRLVARLEELDSDLLQPLPEPWSGGFLVEGREHESLLDSLLSLPPPRSGEPMLLPLPVSATGVRPDDWDDGLRRAVERGWQVTVGGGPDHVDLEALATTLRELPRKVRVVRLDGVARLHVAAAGELLLVGTCSLLAPPTDQRPGFTLVFAAPALADEVRERWTRAVTVSPAG